MTIVTLRDVHGLSSDEVCSCSASVPAISGCCCIAAAPGYEPFWNCAMRRMRG